MSTTKYVLLGALGVAALLLLTTDKGKKLRGDFADLAKDNAKKWKKSFGKMSASAAETVDELKDMLTSEVDGLTGDARERIENIVASATNSGRKLKKNVGNHVA